ncbi:biotin/lipoyl-containing protein, partial [Marinitenerispora sediminis]
QVEHPVTEEVSGIDLVREMFRIAEGEPLGYDDPVLRGHSFEFRINAEDAGRNFMPAPGTITALNLPGGPGVRVDTGCEAGFTVPQAFDSMVAKLVVTGRTREEALRRSRRALAEFEVGGMPTVIPFHQRVVADPAFAPPAGEEFTVHTRWIENEFRNDIPPYEGGAEQAEPEARERVTVEVAGKRIEVVLPAGLGAAATPSRSAGPKTARRGGAKQAAAVSGDALVSPMQGTVVKVVAEDGAEVSEGDTVVVIEAMKMEQPLTAHKSGTVTGLSVTAGETVSNGAVVCEIKES